MKYRLMAPFASISGVIERKRLSNGAVMTLIARKDGTMYWRYTFPRK